MDSPGSSLRLHMAEQLVEQTVHPSDTSIKKSLQDIIPHDASVLEKIPPKDLILRFRTHTCPWDQVSPS